MTPKHPDINDPKSRHYMTPGAREAFNAYRRNAVIGFLILLFGLGFVQWDNNKTAANARKDIAAQSVQADRAIVKSGRAVSVAGCNRDFDTIASLRKQIRIGLRRIDRLEADGTYTKAQADAGREAQTRFLREYKLPDCRSALDIVTDNPRKLGPTPPPKYAKGDAEKPRFQGDKGD